MARRSAATDLAGLAGLATLGYQLLKGNKQDVPVEDISSRAVPAAKAEPDYGEDYAREVARGQRGPIAVGTAKSIKPAQTEKTAEPSTPTVERKAGRGTGQAQLSDYMMRRARDLEAGRSRGRPAEGAPKLTMGAQPTAPSAAPTREELISQIPGSAPADWQGGTGEPVTSTELSRNVNAALMGRGPAALNAMSGLATIPGEMRATRAAQNAYNARAAMRRAEEGMSAAEAAAARQRLAEAALEGGMKKGGSTRKAAAKKTYAKGGAVKKETKPKAKGWGMARGGRAAKIY